MRAPRRSAATRPTQAVDRGTPEVPRFTHGGGCCLIRGDGQPCAPASAHPSRDGPHMVRSRGRRATACTPRESQGAEACGHCTRQSTHRRGGAGDPRHTATAATCEGRPIESGLLSSAAQGAVRSRLESRGRRDGTLLGRTIPIAEGARSRSAPAGVTLRRAQRGAGRSGKVSAFERLDICQTAMGTAHRGHARMALRPLGTRGAPPRPRRVAPCLPVQVGPRFGGRGPAGAMPKPMRPAHRVPNGVGVGRSHHPSPQAGASP